MSVGILHWRKGPAITGCTEYEIAGKFANWNDGDELMIIVDSAGVREISYARISIDDGKLNVMNSDGKDHSWWHPGEWSYWARITPESLPAELK